MKSTAAEQANSNHSLAPQIGIFAVFYLQATVFGSWLPRIADVKSNLELSEGLLGLVLLALPSGTFIALSLGSALIKRTTPVRTLLFSLAAWPCMFTLAASAGSAFWLATALCGCGMVMGLLEIASNLEADSIELRIRKRIMSRCHGFWSLGAMTGALLGGPVFANNGISVQHQFFILAPVCIVIGGFVVGYLARHSESKTVSIGDEAKHKKRSPISSQVFVLCLIPLGIMAIEGSVMDWSAVFMREQLNSSASVAGYTFAMFAAVMAAVRLSGDWLAHTFGDALVVRLSGIAATIGIVLFATATSVAVALVGAALAGAGVAIVYPLAMTAVARVEPQHREDNVAYLSIAAFSVMMLAPPIIGGMAELINLRASLLCLVPGALVTIFLSRRLAQ